jgi:hypothetical protein
MEIRSEASTLGGGVNDVVRLKGVHKDQDKIHRVPVSLSSDGSLQGWHTPPSKGMTSDLIS